MPLSQTQRRPTVCGDGTDLRPPRTSQACRAHRGSSTNEQRGHTRRPSSDAPRKHSRFGAAQVKELTAGSQEARVFDALVKQLGDVDLLDYFDSGSTARVFLVSLPIGSGFSGRVSRIVKVFRHDSAIGVGPEILFQNEVQALMSTSHTNLIAIYAVGVLPLEGSPDVPYYIMEYLPGASDLDSWIVEHAAVVSRETILGLITQACLGIEALHQNRIVHCDIKFGNLLVGSSGNLKVADLGFSKRVVKDGAAQTCVYTTFEPFPKAYQKFIKKVPDRRATYAEIPRELITETFDLHYLGQVLDGLLKDETVRAKFSAADLKYLEVVATRLDLDRPSTLAKYRSISEVLRDIKKLD